MLNPLVLLRCNNTGPECMTDGHFSQQHPHSPFDFLTEWFELGMRSQQVVWSWWLKQAPADAGSHHIDPLGLGEVLASMMHSWLRDPKPLLTAHHHYWRDALALLHHTSHKLAGREVAPVIEPHPHDKRFRDDGWEHPIFSHVQQSYLLLARFFDHLIDQHDLEDERQAHKLAFYSQQWVDALSPGNFPLSNPAVLRTAAETGGKSLLQGVQNLLDDLERNNGQVSMADPAAFTLGKDIACTPGKVVYQNRMFQLIQYAAATEEVYRRPLLIVPPWINKYYILDLQAENSFIRWLVAQGHTVFVMSWVNPDESYSDTQFEDYLTDGVLNALDIVEQASGESEINTVGYCIGGTLLACALAVLAARGDKRVSSATFFTTLLDFEEPGDIKVFIDESQIQALEQKMARNGYLDGRSMSSAFSLLRSNDLIWSFVINNYMLGKSPLAFDLLYWNADATRLPAAMHGYYLRNLYLRNKLREPGGLTMAGEDLDLRAVQTPVYFLSTRDDHIAPWESTYKGARLFSGPVRFVLGASGHIAGVVNPPAKNKYGYWCGEDVDQHVDAEQWLDQSTRHEGSWWPDWQRWVTGLGADRVPARVPGERGHTVLQDAPGSYVAVRI